MNDVRFGVTYNTVMPIGPVDLAEAAEEWGYGSYWAPEFLTLPTLEPFALLAAAAQRTRHIRLGTGVAGLALRSPFQMAKAALTVDTLSKGRLTLGLGIGGVVTKDLDIEGVALKERGKISNERLEILRRLLTEKIVSHDGDLYRFDNVRMGPESVQKPHIPMWVGARWTGRIADAALRRAAQFGDVFIFPADTPATCYKETQDKIRHYTEASGRDPDALEWAGTLWMCLGDSKEEARQTATREIQRLIGIPWEVEADRSYGLGTPDDCAATIATFAELGVSHLSVAPCCPRDQIIDQYQVFAEEVLPQFREEVI